MKCNNSSAAEEYLQVKDNFRIQVHRDNKFLLSICSSLYLLKKALDVNVK